MKNICLVFCVVLFSFFGCKKENENYKLKGIIRNEKTMLEVSNAHVSLYQNSASVWGAPHTDLVSATETDNEGNYGFKFRPYTSTTTLFLVITADSYFESQGDYTIKKDDFKGNFLDIGGKKASLDATIRPR